MTRAVRALAVAFALLTRLPVPAAATDDADRGRAVALFPIVGLMLGIILAAVAGLAASMMPALVGAVVLTAVLAAATGGLHLDGVADVFDGLSAGHGDPTRTLAVMHDSRIGAHGAVALVLVLLAKVATLVAVVQHHDWRIVVLFPAIARWAVVPLVVCMPYARDVGMGKAFNEHSSAREVGWATVSVIAIVMWAGARFVGPALVALAVALLFGVWMRRRLGGMTGDVYGAAIELAEIAFLIAVQSAA